MNQVRFVELALPTNYSGLPDSPQKNFEQSSIIDFDHVDARGKIPDFLKKYRELDTWKNISIAYILQRDSQLDNTNVYVNESILRSHDPNLVFEKVRTLIHNDTFFAFRIVTAENIKFNIQQRLSPVIFPIYYIIHYILRRVLPKLKGFRKISRLLKNPVDISKAEIIGRLIYKGFCVVDIAESAGETIIVARVNSTENPGETQPLPNEGVLFKMRRMGKLGKPIEIGRAHV